MRPCDVWLTRNNQECAGYNTVHTLFCCASCSSTLRAVLAATSIIRGEESLGIMLPQLRGTKECRKGQHWLDLQELAAHSASESGGITIFSIWLSSAQDRLFSGLYSTASNNLMYCSIIYSKPAKPTFSDHNCWRIQN